LASNERPSAKNAGPFSFVIQASVFGVSLGCRKYPDNFLFLNLWKISVKLANASEVGRDLQTDHLIGQL